MALYRAQREGATPDVDVDTQQKTGVCFTFADLTPGEVYNVEINAIGAAGASDFSAVGALRVI